MPMANTAEKLAAQFGITRAQCDEFALRSQVWAASLRRLSLPTAFASWLVTNS
jgi:hypothetical protein